MTFTEAVRSVLSKYFQFSGRAARSEFWYFALFSILGGIVLSIVDRVLFGFANDIQLLSSLFQLAMIIPSIAVGVRRLHDTDRSGWWYLLILIPLIGTIILIVWWANRGTHGPNRFGSDPLGAPDAHLTQSDIPFVPRDLDH